MCPANRARRNTGIRSPAQPSRGDRRDQQVVERDLAELVDDDRAVGHFRSLHSRFNNVVLPLPRKAGDQRYRQSLGERSRYEQIAHGLDIVTSRSDSFP